MPQNSYSIQNAPRYTGPNGIPSYASTSITPPPTTQAYPVKPPDNVFGSGFAISYGVDDKLRTPYSVAADFSVQRELPHGFTLEAAYVGRFGRHLLQQLDLANPPTSGIRIRGWITILPHRSSTGHSTPVQQPSPRFHTGKIYFRMQQQAGSVPRRPSTTICFSSNMATILPTLYLDVICAYPSGAPIQAPCPRGLYWSNQYSSLYAWTTNGSSSYNAGQLMLRHAMSHGLQVDFSYTVGKSIDLESDAERTTSTTSSISGKTTFSQILDAWNPWKNRGPSDFDTRHLITASWVCELPFGKGKAFAGNAGRLVDAVMGGWQFSGLTRWTSGFPCSVVSGMNGGWPTHWNWRSNMVQTAPIKTGLYFNSSGSRMVFPNPQALAAVIPTDTLWRAPYAGDAGNRNNFRGQGYFGVDTGLAKLWKIRESLSVKFSWRCSMSLILCASTSTP